MSWGVYVHVPFCRVRCPYCAFAVEPDAPSQHDDFVARLLSEWERRRGEVQGPPTTLAFGGGTPSRLHPALLGRVVEACAPTGEVSLEANPEDVSRSWLQQLRQVGITRLSLGVQTFDARFARLLNRAHTVRQAREVTRMVAESGMESWSVDVIFGLPGQTPADFAVDLSAILAAEPPHVALYGLTFEPGTPLTRARDQGRMVVEDGHWREMYDTAVAVLDAAGLHRYEVSNFARPGHESQHNRLYWTDRPYLGLGPAAHSYLPDGRRLANPTDRTAWQSEAPSEERPTAEERAADMLLSMLRGVEGLRLTALEERTGLIVDPGTISRLVAGGVLRVQSGRMVLTHSGFPVADGVVGTLVEALHPPD